MKKLPVVASLTFFLTFLVLFIYLYRSSGKFRQSIASALLAALVLFSWSAESTAKDVLGFSTPEFSRPARRPGFFSGKSANNGPGKPEKPVDESYKSNSDLKKVTKNAHKNKRAVKNLEEVQEKLSEGENPMKIGYKPTNLGNGFYYIRKPAARIVVKLDRTTGNSDIVAFGLRSNEKDMEKLAIVVNSQCDTKIKINPKAY